MSLSEDSKEERNSECISHRVVLQCGDTLLQYVDQWDFEYNDTTATRKIQTAMQLSKANTHHKLFIKINTVKAIVSLSNL